MKRLASLLLVVVLVATMVPASLLSALALDVSVISPALPDGYVAVYTGGGEADNFAVDFNLELADGLEAIAGYEVKVSWDSSVLEYTGLATFGSGVVTSEKGESSVVLAVANASDVLSGHLFTVDFCTLAAGNTTVTVEVLSIATASGLIEAEGGSLDISIADGRPTNLAAGLEWTSDTKPGGGYEGDITDGKIEPDGKYDKTLWHGFDKRNTDDNVVTVTIDLGAIYTDIHEVRAHVWPAGYSGIAVPAAYVFYASTDGETYTELANVAGVASDPTWVGTDLEDTIKARYIKFEIIGSEATTFWFVSELEVNAFDPEIYEEPAIETSVTAEVLDGSVKIPAEDALAKLADGNDAAGATAFSDAGLVGFENTGFTHTDGVDAAVSATVAITVDLGEVKTLSKVSLSAYKESNSMIALPSVKFEVSVDGVNFYDINAGGTVSPAEDLAESATATLTADFSTRVAVNARYVRAIATFKNGWIFLSEVGVTTTDAYTGIDPNVAFPYADAVSATAMGVYDAEDGELDLNKLFKNSQLIKAVYDEAAGAYKVIYSKVNPWPDGQTGFETLGDHEILVAINTGGNLVAETDETKVVSNLFSGCKWIARGLTEGDYLVFDAEAGTASFYPAEGSFDAGDCVTTVKEEPPVEEEKHSITISHVNAYNWECYYEMVVVGEGKVATDIYNGNYTNWIAFKVENIDEIYTVTAVEGKGVAKTLVAPADGFLVYCASNDAASFAAAGQVEVGDVLLSCDFDWRKNGASATPMGTMAFGPQPSKDHDHNYTSKVTKEPTLAAEGEMLYVCVCGERYTEVIPVVKAQPDELVELPEGAFTLDYAGYYHGSFHCIIAGDNLTIGDLTALGHGESKDMNYFYIIVVDANGKVVDSWFDVGRPNAVKTDVVCPAGGYIIGYNGNKEGYEALNTIAINSSITLYNIDLEAMRGVAGNVTITNAGFTVVRPEAEIEINVNENELLTDGNTGYTEGWDSTNGKVVLAQNPYCTTVGMNVTLLYALEETKKIESVTVDFYFDKNVMIGYPEGTATVLVSTDGETYTKVGTFDLAEADLSAPGTVSNEFKFNAVEAAYVKVLLYVGSNEAVLGDTPADGKIFWEFISVAEFAVAEAPENLAAGLDWTGDTDCGSSYVGSITDGKIDPNAWGAYDTSVWYGFDQRKTGDSVGTIIIDLGAVYTNLDQIRAYVWPAGASGIAVPQSYDFYISEDGETYTLVTSVAGEKGNPMWVGTDNTETFTARYIKLEIVGTSYDTFWFIGELEVNAYDAQIVETVENTKVEINVNDNDVLTDGKTGFTEGWNAPANDVVLIQNTNCTAAGMDVTLLYALGETKKIDSVIVDLYYDKSVMIGYPMGDVIVLISTDGETYTEVGKFDLIPADFSAPGTVSNVFKFDAVEAAYVKVLLYAGSSTPVLGDSPADGKIFWEFISVAEFAVGEVEEPVENTKVEINVNDNDALTDGETGFTAGWGEVGTGKVELIQNTNCTAAGMDVTLLYALGETKKIDSVTVDLYFDKSVMIGYPEGQAIVLISTDGETYTEVGKFDLTAADFSAPGTVSNAFAFDAVEAAYVKVLLYAGSSTPVLGDSPADGKIFWEFISVAEFAVNVVEDQPEYKFGDINGDGKANTADYVLLKRHIMMTYKLNDDQLTRADINGDGKILTQDYVLLKRLIMGTWTPKN